MTVLSYKIQVVFDLHGITAPAIFHVLSKEYCNDNLVLLSGVVLFDLLNLLMEFDALLLLLLGVNFFCLFSLCIPCFFKLDLIYINITKLMSYHLKTIASYLAVYYVNIK